MSLTTEIDWIFSSVQGKKALQFAVSKTGTQMSKSKSAFREVPYMGVIYVVAEAMKRGFTDGHPDWCNLGQGQQEVGNTGFGSPLGHPRTTCVSGFLDLRKSLQNVGSHPC